MTTGIEPSPPQPDAASGYDRYMLYDAVAIRTQLQRLIDHRCTLTVSGGGAADSTATALLEIRDSHMWVDVPRNPAVLQRLLRSEKLSFDGRVDNIEVRFSTQAAATGTHEGGPALRVPLPERLLHLQRRELMRREPPGILNCLVPRKLGGAAVTGAVATTIRDIGGGGLAVLADDALALSVGDLLPGCVIELAELGQVEVTLRVRHIREFSQRGKTLRQAGCEFIDLPAAAQEKLFRYLMQIDRQRLARQRGFKSD